MSKTISEDFHAAVKQVEVNLMDMAYINSPPQPLWDGDWPIQDIEVETGLYRIDVCGLLETRHIGGCHRLRDETGAVVYVGDLYLEQASWETREIPE
jgi:hypothetical protein